MRDQIREHLSQEVTRKQFLQFMTTALLMVLGVNNLISLLSGTRPGHSFNRGNSATGGHGFGSSKFGV